MYSDDDLISSIRNKKKPTDPLEAPTEPTNSNSETYGALEDDYLGPVEEAAGETPQEPTEADKLKKRILEILG